VIGDLENYSILYVPVAVQRYTCSRQTPSQTSVRADSDCCRRLLEARYLHMCEFVPSLTNSVIKFINQLHLLVLCILYIL